MEWTKQFSKTHQREYWFNTATGERSWENPVASSHKDVDVDDSDQPTKKVKRTDRIAIIIPFRETPGTQTRTNQLNRFIPHMNDKLAGCDFTIFVVEQSDDGRRFNRGKLLNIGFDIARTEGYSIFVFHDVDLLPDSELAEWYKKVPKDDPIHIARPWKRYAYSRYFGGIVSFSREMFERINGFPNNFWGWGGEDDELSTRVREAGMVPVGASGNVTDLEGIETAKEKNEILKKENAKCMNKTEVLEEHKDTWRTNGLMVKSEGGSEQLKKFEYDVLARLDEPVRHYSKITVDIRLNNHPFTDRTSFLNTSQLAAHK